MSPDELQSLENVNLLVHYKKDMQEAMRTIPDAEKRLAIDLASGYLQDALPVLGGFLASGKVGEQRYGQWLTRRVANWLEFVNQSPWFINGLGGPLAPDEPLLLTIWHILDRLLADFGVIAATSATTEERPSLPGDNQLSQLHRLALFLSRSNASGSPEFEQKWVDYTSRYADVVAALLIFQHISEPRRWRIVFGVNDFDWGDGCEFEMAFDDNGESWPYGRYSVAHFRFFEADAGQSVADVALNTCFASHRWSPPERPRQFDAGLYGDAAIALIIDLHVHPAAVASAAELKIEALSGLLGLTREDRMHGYRIVANETGDNEVVRPKRRTLKGTAMAISEPSTRGLQLCGPGIEYADVHAVSVSGALLPSSECDVVALTELVARNPVCELVVHGFLLPQSIPLGRPGKPSVVIDPIRKAFQFWSRAESSSVAIARRFLTPWAVADAYLQYCTVLEILLGSGGDLTEMIASRAAGIIAVDPQSRCEMRTSVRKLYNLRSKFVHEGAFLVRLDDLRKVRDVARRCLTHAIQWLTRGVEGHLREQPERLNAFFGNLRGLDCDSAPDLLRAMAEMATVLPKEDFGEHCDMLRFGAARASR